MDPTTQPQPPITPSIDYLNQIAPQTPKKLKLSRMQLIIVAAVTLAIVVVVVLVIVVNASSNKGPLQHLAARLQSTETIVSDGQGKLKSSSLRALNSNLKIYLTNTNRDIATPLLSDKVDTGKLDKDIVASETSKDITARLEDARLNAIYDRTYAREVAYRLETILALMHQINSSTGSTSLKNFLTSAISNLEPTQKSFADFNSTNG